MILLQDRIDELKKLEESINYSFKDKSLLNSAFIHTSYTNENTHLKGKSNERLEFLGDAVLETVYSEILYKKLTDQNEGYLTKLRSQLVCEASFSEFSDKLNLASYLLLGKGEEKTGGRSKNSIKADVFEAFIGALYLDAGYQVVYTFIYEQVKDTVSHAKTSKRQVNDYKSMLQEYLHKYKNVNCQYKLTCETGPAHNKVFCMDVYKDSKKIGSGKGRNKKLAEQMAAKNALENLGLL